MGFWKRNREKIAVDTISGLLIRIVIGATLLVLGIWIAPKFVTLPVDNVIVKELIDLARRAILYVYFILIFFMREILNWLSERREAKIRESESKNEGLRLQKEILELEIQRENQQSSQSKESPKEKKL